MADWPAYKAGSARLTLRPKLANDFRAQVKKQLAPINESLKVTVESVLMRGFKTDLRSKLNAATKGLSVDIEARPKLAAGFRTDLRNKLNAATSGMTVKVGVKIDTTGVRSRIRGATSGVGDVKIPVNVDLTQATAQLEAFRTGQAAIPLTMNVNVDTAAAVAQLMALRSLAGAVGEQVGGIGTGGALGRGRRLRGNIFTRPIRAIRLQIEIDRASVARAEAEVANIATRLSQARQRQGDALDRLRLAEERHNEVMARGNATASQRLASTQRLARAQRDLADAQGRVNGLMGEEADADRRLDRARRDQGGFRRVGRLFGAGLSGLASSLNDLGSRMLSFRNLTNLATVALVALAAVSLIPLLGQITQAAGVIALLPAVLTGAVAVFATVKIGLGGVGDAFKAAGKAAEDAGKDAEQHAKQVASAQKQQASAARAVVSAERGVRDAQRNTLQAQRDLNRARQDAKKDIDDLNRALGRTALTEESAAIAVAEAHREMLRTFADPEADAIDRARARNSFNQALADQQDVLRENAELRERAAEANAKGVEGSDQVVAAQERVNQAIEAEGDARQSLTDAQAALVEAQQAVTDAMNEGSASAEAYEKALSKLSPAAQDFVRRMVGLKPALGELRGFIQEKLLNQLGEAIEGLTRRWIPNLKDGLGGIAEEINGGLRRALADLDTEASRNKVSKIFENVEKSVGPFLDGLNDVIQGFLSLSQVGSEFLPGLSGSFADLAERFRNWAESPEGQQKFRDFIAESLRTFNQILDIAKELGGVIAKIFGGSDEVGESWLDSMEKTFREWNNFLGTPEGQQKIKDFFNEVKTIVEAIVDAIKLAKRIIDFFGGPGVKSSPDRKPPEPIIGGAQPGVNVDESGTPVQPGVSTQPGQISVSPDAIDPSRTEPGGIYYNYRGERVDRDGNKLDHTGGLFPGFREGSVGDRANDVGSSTADFFGGGAFDGIKRRPGQSPFDAILEQARMGWELKWEHELKPRVLGSIATVQASLAGLASSLKQRAGEMVGSLYEFGQSAKKELSEKVGDALTGLKDSLPDIGSAVEDFQVSAGEKFNTLQNVSTSVIDVITGDTVLGKFKSELGTFPGFFDGIVNGIGSAWSRVVSAVQGPVNSVIDVLNGFGAIWNQVAGKLGLPPWEPIGHVGAPGTAFKPQGAQPIPGRAKGGPGGPYKSGRVDGPGNRYDDKAGVYRLARGEHVWTADEVDAAGGHDVMYQWRRNVLAGGGKQSRGGGFADGGGVVQTSDPLDPIQVHLWDLVRNAIPGAILTSAKRFVDVGSGFDLHMQGKAIDLGGPMKQIARWIYNTYPQSAELIHWPLDGWQNLDEGRPFNFGSATNEGHRDHVHWAANDFLTQMSEEDKRSLFDRVREGIGGIVSGGRTLLVENLLSRPLRALADQVPTFDALGEFGQIPRAFARKMADTVIGWVTSKLGGESGGQVVDYDPSGGGEQWREMAIAAMRRVGFNADDPNQVNAMLSQIQSESGGNPNIAQQIVDINGTGEKAGVGLLQIIPGTYEAHRDPELPNNRRDPFSNMVAALRYYKSRYGMDLTTMWGKGHGYDQGGILKDKHWGFNLSGKPEAVLTNPEWTMFRQFIDRMPGMSGTPKTLEQNITPAQPQQQPGNTTLFGGPPVEGVDTVGSLWKKTQDRFKSAFDTGLSDMWSANIGVLGIPNPLEFPAVQAVQGYAEDVDAWQRARQASAAASQSLSSAGYSAASAPSTGAANAVMSGNGSGPVVNNIDNSMTFHISAANPGEGLRKAQQFADLHALQHTSRS